MHSKFLNLIQTYKSKHKAHETFWNQLINLINKIFEPENESRYNKNQLYRSFQCLLNFHFKYGGWRYFKWTDIQCVLNLDTLSEVIYYKDPQDSHILAQAIELNFKQTPKASLNIYLKTGKEADINVTASIQFIANFMCDNKNFQIHKLI